MKTWFIHNFFIHLVKAVLSLIGFKDLGVKLHDATLPNNKKEVK